MLQGTMIEQLIASVERAEEHAQQAELSAIAAYELQHCPTPMYEMARVETLLGVA